MKSETFQDASQYIKSLQEKAATSAQSSMFQMEAESIGETTSTGGDFGVVGAMTGAAIGAYAAGPAGAVAGIQLGKALGEAISFNVGSASGSGSNSRNGNRNADSSGSSSRRRNNINTVHMVAVLEATMKLYEITLDDVTPNDLSPSFLADFMDLPLSYSQVGAPVAFQDFILRYGTHFIKSAKFGGELKIIKTSKRESKLNSEEFASAAQSEFAGMMGTLKNSFEQSSYDYSILGFGQKNEESESNASNEQSQNARNEASQRTEGQQRRSRSEFIKTTVQVQGGDPSVAAAITDFYTPRFRETLVKWLNTISKYAKPYEFTLGRISEMLDLSPSSFFTEQTSNSGCFNPDAAIDDESGKHYYLRNVSRLDSQNKSVSSIVRVFCKFGYSKDTFMDSMKSMRLALERAENVYLMEGPISLTNFDVEGGRKGCQRNNIEFAMAGDEIMKTWPKSWEAMSKLSQFKVVFDMAEDLPSIRKDAEYIMKYYDNLWWTRRPSGHFSMAATCIVDTGAEKSVCIAGVPFTYSENDGFFMLDDFTFSRYNQTIPLPLWKKPLARAEQLEMSQIEESQRGSIGFIPCNQKWSNRHRIRVDEKSKCIYFQVATAGSLYLTFAGIPSNVKTWFYLRVSPEGVSFYDSMKLREAIVQPKMGTLGSKDLYVQCFVCIRKEMRKYRVQYGKSVKNSELGSVYAAYDFDNEMDFDDLYYAFGAGEDSLHISDVRVVNNPTQLSCMSGLVLQNGLCALECHPQCNGCHKSNDPGSCKQCRGKKFITAENLFTCVEECPEGTELIGSECSCKAGYQVDESQCIKCLPGRMGDGVKCQECPDYTHSNSDSSACVKCPSGQRSAPGKVTCGEN